MHLSEDLKLPGVHTSLSWLAVNAIPCPLHYPDMALFLAGHSHWEEPLQLSVQWNELYPTDTHMPQRYHNHQVLKEGQSCPASLGCQQQKWWNDQYGRIHFLHQVIYDNFNKLQSNLNAVISDKARTTLYTIKFFCILEMNFHLSHGN